MKSTTFAFAILCILPLFNSCTSTTTTENATTRSYFGEGGSSQDTLYLRAENSPVGFVVERNFKGEGGSSQDTLYFAPKEYAKFYRIKDPKKKK